MPIVIAAFLASGCAASKPPAQPADSILGVRIGMPEEDVLRTLEKVGRLERNKSGPGGAKQFWELRDRRFSWIALRLDEDMRVEWVTAFAREGRRRVRYADVADPAEATKQGSYIYTWWVTGREDSPAFAVTARGADPEYLSSMSLFRSEPKH